MEAGVGVCLELIKYCRQNDTVGWLVTCCVQLWRRSLARRTLFSYVSQACYNAYIECNFLELVPVQSTGVNVYDVREQCKVAPLCYDFSAVDKFLAKPDVIKALGVTGRSWTSCNRVVDLALVMAGDWMLDYSHQLPPMLASNISVVVYSGEFDFVCNW